MKVYTFSYWTTGVGFTNVRDDSDRLFKTLKVAEKAALAHATEEVNIRLSEYREPDKVDYKISTEGGLHIKVGASYNRQYRIIEKQVEV